MNDGSPQELFYRVRDARFDTHWAMRESDITLLSGEARNQAAAAFLREAEKLAQLRHPGLAQIVDHFTTAERAYLITEWVEGEMLLARLQAAAPLAPQQVVELGSEL